MLNAPPRGGCKYNIEINTKRNKSRLCNEVAKVLDFFSFLVQFETYDLKMEKKKSNYTEKIVFEFYIREQ